MVFTSNIMPVTSPDTSLIGTCFPWSTGLGKIYTAQDTMINSNTYKILDSHDYFVNYVCRYGYIREDTAARKVFFTTDATQPETVIYDFSLSVADTISLNFISSPWSFESGIYQLDSIRPYTTSAGFITNAYYLNCIDCSSVNRTVEWIEGIGARADLTHQYTNNQYTGFGVFWPCSGGNYPYDFSQVLTVFSHDNIIYYDSCALQQALSNSCFAYYDTCSYWYNCSAINELASSIMEIKPNPATDKIWVSLKINTDAQSQFIIRDIAGSILRSEKHQFIS
jgi:hypothetical protein